MWTKRIVPVLAAAGLAAMASAGGRTGLRPRNLPAVPDGQLGGVIWGAECREPAGRGLAFGGEDPAGDDGGAHTRVLDGGVWKSIRRDLEAAHSLQPLSARAALLSRRVKDALAAARRLYFAGLTPDNEAARIKAEIAPLEPQVQKDLTALAADLGQTQPDDGYEQGQVALARSQVDAAAASLRAAVGAVSPDALTARAQAQLHLQLAAEALAAEPPPRALSPLAYDAQSGLYVLFGGDHLDYLTNDTWVFDAAKPRWMQRRPAGAPRPRAGHTLTASDGKVTLTGGYTYTSNTDYCGGQYADLNDGPWIYDVAANAWTGPGGGENRVRPLDGFSLGSDPIFTAADAGATVPPDSRTWRTGPFHPDFFLQGPRPDAAQGEARLKDLPANTWVALRPTLLPRLDRVWGTAVLDPNLDVILVWCGGHSSHGGSDVLHYHLATNRWELPYPVEFPLGQLYSNTSYPDSFNFNRRPWPTGHTYRSYAYDLTSQRMLFAGHTRHWYVYDPAVADWTGRFVKPKQMAYPGCFYDLTLCTTPQGVMAWGGYYGRREYSKISRFDAAANAWSELPLTGDLLPGSVCDRSSLVYDSKRKRLLAIVGQKDGCEMVSVDLASLKVTKVTPGGAAAAGRIAFFREFCYDPVHDLVVGTTLPPDAAGLRRTPAYDCAGNRWVSLKIPGPNPSGKDGRNVSLGLIYDPKRDLIWGMDNYSLQPYVLRLDPATADRQPL